MTIVNVGGDRGSNILSRVVNFCRHDCTQVRPDDLAMFLEVITLLRPGNVDLAGNSLVPWSGTAAL
ncbi:MAG: hypothetical protein ACTSUE_26990 [Promethearchaeota archaeon]